MGGGEQMSDNNSEHFERIDAKLDFLLTELEAVKRTVNEVVPHIKPLVEQLESSALFRMLTGGKR